MRIFKDYKASKFIILLIIVLFRIILDYLYINVIQPRYYYMGMILHYSKIYSFISWIALFLLTLLIFNILKINKNGALIVCILLITSAIPTTVIIAFVCHDIKFVILNILYWYSIVFFYKHSFLKFKIPKIKLNNSKLLLNIIFLTYFFMILYIAIRYNFNFTINLYKAYDIRNEFKSLDMPLLLHYIFNSSNVVFSIFLVYWANNKKRIYEILCIIGFLLLFFISGRKSSVFILIITLIVYKYIKELSLSIVPIGMLFTTIIGLIELFVNKTDNFINLFTRRLFIVPAFLQYAYYDFFKTMPKSFFRQGLIANIFGSPYSERIPEIIGRLYIGKGYANNGLFSDSYSNLGILGIFVLPILISISLKLLDKVSKDLKESYAIGFCLVSSMLFLSSSFFTVLISHGYLIGCLLLFIISESMERNMKYEG